MQLWESNTEQATYKLQEIRNVTLHMLGPWNLGYLQIFRK